jgi:granule-bound starch synthase
LHDKGPAKEWERALLSLGVKGSELGFDGEDTVPLMKENEANASKRE